MKKKVIFNENKSLNDFHISHCFTHKIKENRLLTKEEFDKRKTGKYFKVNDNYYLKLPLLKIKTWKIIGLSLVGVLVGGAAATVTVFYLPHQVKLNSNCLEIVENKSAHLASDYTCTFKIKDDLLASRYMDNIEISSVKVSNKEIPVEAYSFIYQTNKKNQLTINRRYLNGDVEINADLVSRKCKQNSFWFEFNIADYADFNKSKVTVPIGETIHIKKDTTQEEYLPLFIKAFEFEKEGFDIVDNVLIREGVNLILIDKWTYTIDLEDIGLHYSFSTPFDMIFVREDNTLKFDIVALENKTLPKNLWLRSNARFTKKGEDFFLNFSSDYKTATMEIPYFFIRDNGSLAVNPNEENK